MGHKVNPVGLRLGINRTWDSRWFAGADYSKLLHEDLKLREHLRLKLRGAHLHQGHDVRGPAERIGDSAPVLDRQGSDHLRVGLGDEHLAHRDALPVERGDAADGRFVLVAREADRDAVVRGALV